MTRYDHFMRLLVLIAFVIAGLLLTAAVSAILMLMGGMSLNQLMEMSQNGVADFSPGLTRMLLAVQHLLTFIIPGLAFGLLFYKAALWRGMDLGTSPGWIVSALGILFLLAAYPLVNLGFLVNEAIPLPAWAMTFEDQAKDTLKAILDMKSPGVFLINFVLIAILPGIGEELIFRGILQKELSGILRNPIAALWIAAFIFSAIHLQFEGFLPRMALGAVLGYLYYWTRNLWVPMIAHAFNNGIQVVWIYVTGMDPTALDEESSDQLSYWMLLISVAVMFLIYSYILKNRKPVEQA